MPGNKYVDDASSLKINRETKSSGLSEEEFLARQKKRNPALAAMIDAVMIESALKRDAEAKRLGEKRISEATITVKKPLK